MKYRGVRVIKIDSETYGFIYDGCPDKLLDNHYGDFYIIKHVGDKCFYKLYDQYQNKRLDPQFWIKHIKTLQKNDTLKEFERALRVVPSPLREAVFLLK